MLTVRMSDFVKNVPALYSAKVEGRSVSTVTLGRPGCGKSAVQLNEIPKALRKALGVPVEAIAVNFNDRDYIDVRGPMIPFKDANGELSAGFPISDVGKMIRDMAERVGENGIGVVVLEEVMQNDGPMKKAIAPILYESQIGTYKAPNNIWFVGNGNRYQDNALVQKMSAHTANRCKWFEIQPDTEYWLKNYARPNELPEIVQAWAGYVADDMANVQSGGKQIGFSTPIDALETCFLSHRSLTHAAADIKVRIDNGDLQEMELPKPDKDYFLYASVAGSIGQAAATSLFAYADTIAEFPKIEEIAADPLKARMPKDLAAQYAMAGYLIRGVTHQNIDALWKYATRPDGMRRQFLGVLIDMLDSPKLSGVLMGAPGMLSWLSDPANKDIVAARSNRA